MLIREIMSTPVEWITPDVPLKEAAAKMRDLDVGSLPVAENDRLIGMLTDRDIVIRCIATGKDPGAVPARAAMSGNVYYCQDDQTVHDVAANMGEMQVRRMPVIDRDKRLVGILSLGDVAKAVQASSSGDALKEISETPAEHR
jgi:CBS domain-containing protein